MSIPPPRLRPSTRCSRWWALILVAVVVVIGSACQVQVVVDTVVDSSGAGTVKVSVGLDAAAWERLEEHDPQIQIQDLRLAGWEVTEPEVGADGITWIRASKPFSSPQQLESVFAEIAGADTLFKDIEFQRVETDDDITYRLTGDVDLSKGVATFSDPELAAQLGGDPFGGNLAAIEAEEGRPISEMVTFEVTTRVAGGAPATLRPTLTDTAPVALDVATVEVKPPSPVIRIAIGAAVVVGIIVVIVALAGARRHVGAKTP